MATETAKFDISKLSIREIVIMIGTLLSAIGYGFYQFEYSVQTKKLTKLERQLQEVQASVGALQNVTAHSAGIDQTNIQITKIKGEIDAIQSDIEKAKSRLTGQDTEIFNSLQSEADFYGVFLKSIKSSERNLSRAGLRLKEVSLIIEVESDYDALKSFIASLKDLPAVITIQSLETTRDEKLLPKLESRLHIKVIVL
jgi:Tfp pilus assembly protein PilO